MSGDWPTPEVAFNLDVALVKSWSYYDNYQHGYYVNENATGYGPIKVYNATVLIDGVEVFGGDVSVKRFDQLVKLSKTHNVQVKVFYEGRRAWITISKGVARHFEKRYRPRKGVEDSEAMAGLGALFA